MANKAVTPYQLNPWPRRIYIEQDGLGIVHASIYDADTGQQMTAVMSLVISHHDGSVIEITQSKYTPAKSIYACDLHDPDLRFPVKQNIICDSRMYPITKLSISAGTSPE